MVLSSLILFVKDLWLILHCTVVCISLIDFFFIIIFLLYYVIHSLIDFWVKILITRVFSPPQNFMKNFKHTEMLKQ